MMDGRYPHLHFREWPFWKVPDDTVSRFMADRKQVLEEVHLILRGLSRRDRSSIHPMWAWFGAGKSHTLRHICHLCRMNYPELLPVYTEFPRAPYSFIDLYTLLVQALDWDTLRKLCIEALRRVGRQQLNRQVSGGFREFTKAVEILGMGNEEHQEIATAWLQAERVHLATLKSLGIARRIETPDDAVRAASSLVRLVALSQPYSRLVWIIDEFQRIATCKSRLRAEINTCLHSMFNNCPNSLSLFLSFSVRMQEHMFALLSQELIDRIGIERRITMPPLSREEARVFVEELFHELRTPDRALPSQLFPFEDECVDFVIRQAERKGDLTPRSIMDYFNAVLDEADPLIEKGEIAVITCEFARQVFKRRPVEEVEQE